MKQLVLVTLLVSIIVTQKTTAIDLPVPASGFAWQEIPELKAAFL